MSEEARAADAAAEPAKAVCRHCRQAVHPEATRCHHCHGELADPVRARVWLQRGGVWLGLVTTALSVFYALREGWFWVEARQRERGAYYEYVEAAELFEASHALEQAEWAFAQAAAIRPNDLPVRIRHFRRRGERVLRELEEAPARVDVPEVQAAIRQTIREGAVLLQADLRAEDRTAIVILLARAVPQELSSEPGLDVIQLLESARKQGIDDPKLEYELGVQLLGGEREAEGIALLERAAKIAPGDPRTWAALAEAHRKRRDFAAAARAYQQAFELRSTASGPEQVRAANGSVGALPGLLFEAAQEADVTSAEFHGLSLQERDELFGLALEHASIHSDVAMTVARYFHSRRDFEKAERAVKLAISDDELERPARYHDLAALGLYAELLERRGDEPERLAKVRELMAGKRDDVTYARSLEVRDESSRWRTGITVLRESDRPGVEVVDVIADYPFAKAGVRPGDRILKLDHVEVNAFEDVVRRIVQLQRGEEVRLAIEREGALLELVMKVE